MVELTKRCEGRRREEEKEVRDGGFYRRAYGQSHADISQLGLVAISLFFVLFVCQAHLPTNQSGAVPS